MAGSSMCKDEGWRRGEVVGHVRELGNFLGRRDNWEGERGKLADRSGEFFRGDG